MVPCTADDPEPALHSQLGKTDGEVTNLVSCDTSVLYTRSPQGRSASGGPLFKPQGRVIPVGLSSGTARGWPGACVEPAAASAPPLVLLLVLMLVM